MTNPMQQKVSATLEQWKAQFDNMQAKFKEKVADARMEHQTDSWKEDLEKKFQEAQSYLQVMREETEETASQAKADFERKMAEIEKDLNK
ncbi:MAG: hypothetical protein WDZ94_02515 [Patescibacteria group bacterium]